MESRTAPWRGKALRRLSLPITPWREPRGARGAAVMEAVTRAGLASLGEKASRDITVVEIAQRAGVARASLLLQFPDGLPDVLSAAVNHEYEKIVELEESLWSSAPPRTPLDAMHRLIEAIHGRAKATGLLYSNLMSEALQTAGDHRGHLDGSFGLLGMMFAFRANADVSDEEGLMHVTALALGEVLARSVWSATATDWAVSSLMNYKGDSTPSALQLSYLLAEALLPRLRQETMRGPVKPQGSTSRRRPVRRAGVRK